MNNITTPPNNHNSRILFTKKRLDGFPRPTFRSGLKCPSCGSKDTKVVDESSGICSQCKSGFSLDLYIQTYGYPASPR